IAAYSSWSGDRKRQRCCWANYCCRNMAQTRGCREVEVPSVARTEYSSVRTLTGADDQYTEQLDASAGDQGGTQQLAGLQFEGRDCERPEDHGCLGEGYPSGAWT